MGAWSASILGNDTSSDVRTDFRFLIGEGLTPEAATSQVLHDWKDLLDDSDCSADIWLGLAAAQVQCGRLTPLVRDKALSIIDSGEDLERWRELALDDDPALIRQRAAALAKLRAKLVGPQRHPTRIRKQYIDRTDWEPGHAIGYQLRSGSTLVMRVVAVEEDRRGNRTACMEVCDWQGVDPPALDVLEQLPRRYSRQLKPMIDSVLAEANEWKWSDRRFEACIADMIETDGKFAIYATHPHHFPADRVQVLATGLRIKLSDFIGASYFGGWPYLDDHLRNCFGIE